MSGGNDHGAPFKSTMSVLSSETRCVIRTAGLLIRGRLALRPENVGRHVTFADGSRSRVYRESAMRRRHHKGLVLIVVRFRLRFIGRNRFAHWLFRIESLLNTFLFAAHPGFETKLWLTDPETGFYRGIYEWRGRHEAIEYAETLRVVLRPWVTAGSFDYHVIEGMTRREFLEGITSEECSSPADAWWQSAASEPIPARADGP